MFVRPRNFSAALMALALIFGSRISAEPLFHLEGRIGDAQSKESYYDVLITVRDGNQSDAKLLESIQVPRVKVSDGRFAIEGHLGLLGLSGMPYSLALRCRPSESFQPFEPAELSKSGWLETKAAAVDKKAANAPALEAPHASQASQPVSPVTANR